MQTWNRLHCPPPLCALRSEAAARWVACGGTSHRLWERGLVLSEGGLCVLSSLIDRSCRPSPCAWSRSSGPQCGTAWCWAQTPVRGRGLRAISFEALKMLMHVVARIFGCCLWMFTHNVSLIPNPDRPWTRCHSPVCVWVVFVFSVACPVRSLFWVVFCYHPLSTFYNFQNGSSMLVKARWIVKLAL